MYHSKVLSPMRYSKVEDSNGSVVFQLFNENNKFLLESPEIAVVFDRDCGTLLKHGSKLRLQEWLEDTRLKYQIAGLEEEADALAMISSSTWNLEELNLVINSCGHVKSIYQRLHAHHLS